MFSNATSVGIAKLTAFEVRNIGSIAYAVEQKIPVQTTMSKLIVESGAVFNAKSSMQNDATNIAPLKKITNFNDAREKTA